MRSASAVAHHDLGKLRPALNEVGRRQLGREPVEGRAVAARVAVGDAGVAPLHVGEALVARGAPYAWGGQVDHGPSSLSRSEPYFLAGLLRAWQCRL